MKKIILISLFGLVFSQAEVSQKTINVTIDGGSYTNLNTIFPDYNLDWAIINIVDCPTQNCWITADNNDASLAWLGHANQSNFHYQGTNSFLTTLYANHNTSMRFVFGQDGTYTMKLLVTAEFPIEDTGYIEEGFDFCLVPGNNLVAFPCDNPVSVETAIPELAQAEIEQIIGAGQAATNLNGQFIGSLSNFTPGAGYWFKSSSSMCFNYTCAE